MCKNSVQLVKAIWCFFGVNLKKKSDEQIAIFTVMTVFSRPPSEDPAPPKKSGHGQQCLFCNGDVRCNTDLAGLCDRLLLKAYNHTYPAAAPLEVCRCEMAICGCALPRPAYCLRLSMLAVYMR